MRVFFTTDIHGSERCFRKFLNAGPFYEADVLILGGDMTGKAIVPLIHMGGSTYRCTFVGRERTVEGEAVDELEGFIRASGFYPFRTTDAEVSALEVDPVSRDKKFTQLMLECLERWMALAKERLADKSIRCFMTPGNDDRPDIDAILDASDFVENPEGGIVELHDGTTTIEMISSGWSGPTPFDTPRECSEEELRAKIDAMATRLRAPDHSIFNLHDPPVNSRLDIAPALDGNLRVQSEGGRPRMVPVGSTAVRAAIEEYRPQLGVHGHIHESRGSVKIGPTTCLNPGSEYGEGVLRGAVIDFRKGRLRNVQLVSG